MLVTSLGLAALGEWRPGGWTALDAFDVPTLGNFWQGLHVTQRVPAPGDREREIVVSQGTDLIDGVWALDVRAGHGIAARQWRFGCLNDDASPGLRSVGWAGPEQVDVVLQDGSIHSVRVDAATGRPLGIVSTWTGCVD